MFLGIIVTVLGGVGVYGVFSNSILLIAIGAAAGLFENIKEYKSGRQNNFVTIILASIVGSIVYLLIRKPFWLGIMAGMCFESLIIGVISYIPLVIAFRKQ